MERIAIVGMGAVLPSCRNLDEFWEHIVSGTDLSQSVPGLRWGQSVELERHLARQDQLDGIPHSKGYFVNRSDWDFTGLDLSPSELEGLDPIFQFVLQAGRDAFFDCQHATVDRSKAGIILGSLALPTEASSRFVLEAQTASSGKNTAAINFFPSSMPTQKLAQALGFGSPCLALDAACASSLYAIKYACDELQSGRSSLMLAGGVCRPDGLFTQMGFHQLKALSLTGKSAPFDEKADGLLVGEGAAIFALKRLSDAKAAGDHIYGLIAGIGLSNDLDGRLMAPSVKGQLRAMQEAYQAAGWGPEQLDFLECHATGTKIGDETELKSWNELRSQHGVASTTTVVSSLKGNIGHLLTASAAAGLLRVLLCLKQKILPPTVNYQTSPAGQKKLLESSRSRVLTQAEAWPEQARARRAAISAFGFGGTNAHLLIEEWQGDLADPQVTPVFRQASAERVAIVGIGWQRADDLTTRGEHRLSRWSNLLVPSGRFRIPPHEFQDMLPQQTAMLLAADQAAQAAGWNGGEHERAGVYIGLDVDASANAFARRWSSLSPTHATDYKAIPALSAGRVLGSLASIVASRIAREYRCGGRGLSFSSLDNSGLMALDLALREIRNGLIDEAIVGAVDHVTQQPTIQALENIAHDLALPQAGHYEDLALALVLRPESQVRDRDQVIAWINGDLSFEQQRPDLSLPVNNFGMASGLMKFVESLSLSQAMQTYQSWLGVRVQWQLSLIQAFEPAPAQKSENVIVIASKQLMPDESLPLTRPSQAFLDTMLELTRQSMEAGHRAQESFMDLQKQVLEDCRQFLTGSSTQGSLSKTPELEVKAARLSPDTHESALFDYEACREFAEGQIQKVFGREFAEVDSYPSRVRLPMDRLLLCHRVMAIGGEAMSLGPGTLVTEHDVSADSWYLDHGHIPTAIAIEAGQADLMLSAWLGADFHTKGLAVYRLLDAKVTFQSRLPKPGDVIRYNIRIERFFRQGQTLFFRFGFAATVNGQPLLAMEDGCAGFFSQQALDAGRGIVKPAFQQNPRGSAKLTGGYQPRFQAVKESYTASQLDALRQGRLATCFGNDFARHESKDVMTIPGGDLRLVHRISNLESEGGWYGLGLVIGEADIDPDDWFLTCHFKDDHVMPGTLMYECCLHTLRIYLLRMGWIGSINDIEVAPLAGLASQLKCRGQVLSHTKTVRYELHIREMGYQPDAYVIADALMYADDKLIVDIQNMNLSLVGLTQSKIDQAWEQGAPELVFRQHQIQEFAAGMPSKAFGESYRCFDQQRRMARLPREPYQFITEVLTCTTRPWQMHAGGEARARYHFGLDDWYFKGEPGHKMPFSVLLEVGLQACGWMAAYMGSALKSSEDLFFRNLQGKGQLLQEVGAEDEALLTDVVCTNVSQSAGMILQSYAFEVRKTDESLVYQGETSFGFFTEAALADQKGLKIDELPQLPPHLADSAYKLAQSSDLLMLSQFLSWDRSGGQHGLGRALATKQVKKDDWYFHAHFYQDPVMPGSLGLEGMIQLMREVAKRLWPDREAPMRMLTAADHEWLYRGQVRPYSSLIVYDLHLKQVDLEGAKLVADGFLWVDGLAIYRIKNFTLG